MVTPLDAGAKKEIVDAIIEAERFTSGEIRVHLIKKPVGDILEHAKKIFIKLGMQRTRDRNAALIVVALESREFAIVGDSGIDRIAGGDFWAEARDRMLRCFSDGQVKEGILSGVAAVGDKLKKHFLLKGGGKNELDNEVTQDR